VNGPLLRRLTGLDTHSIVVAHPLAKDAGEKEQGSLSLNQHADHHGKHTTTNTDDLSEGTNSPKTTLFSNGCSTSFSFSELRMLGNVGSGWRVGVKRER